MKTPALIHKIDLDDSDGSLNDMVRFFFKFLITRNNSEIQFTDQSVLIPMCPPKCGVHSIWPFHCGLFAYFDGNKKTCNKEIGYYD